jgi:stalled ribosome rescue protein Dom34
MKSNYKFGIWMDSIHATIVEADPDNGQLKVLTHVTAEEKLPTENEKAENNQKIMLQAKYFKEIAAQLQNATHVHLTGTGQAQEQFMHYLAQTPRFKNTKTEESTSNRMSDEKLLDYLIDKLK